MFHGAPDPTPPPQTVAILSPGDMGHVVGQVLRRHGLRVTTCLAGRSARTRALAAQAQIEEVESLPHLVQEADLILSILVPAQAMAAAEAVAAAATSAGVSVVYADCNAVAPETARAIAARIEAAGGVCVDASIIGGPPRREGETRFYVSGPHSDRFVQLGRFGLEVVDLGSQIGDASALKICYAALTKGLTALGTELLVAAQALGVLPALQQEFERSQPDLYRRLAGSVPAMPAKARRWVGEMEEIGATFGLLGLTPALFAGAADIYRFVGRTTLADRTPEDSSPALSLAETLARLAAALQEPAARGGDGPAA